MDNCVTLYSFCLISKRKNLLHTSSRGLNAVFRKASWRGAWGASVKVLLNRSFVICESENAGRSFSRSPNPRDGVVWCFDHFPHPHPYVVGGWREVGVILLEVSILTKLWRKSGPVRSSCIVFGTSLSTKAAKLAKFMLLLTNRFRCWKI